MSNDLYLELYPELQDFLAATIVRDDRSQARRDRKAFEADIKKDKRFTLPAGKILPYQLWFGFLKAALTDPDLHVDREFYRPWGPVETMTFEEWWPDHWRELFAIDESIRVAERPEDVDVRDGVLWVRLPLGKKRGFLVSRVGELVYQRQSARDGAFEQGNFGFSCGTDTAGRRISPATRFLKNLDNVDALLWFYAAWLHIDPVEGVERDEEAAEFVGALVQYASKRKRLIKAPNMLRPLLAELKSRGGKKYVPSAEQKDKNRDNYLRQLDRYLHNARQIAANVAQGQFPGRYQNPDRTEP